MMISTAEQLHRLFYCLGFGMILNIGYSAFKIIRLLRNPSSVRIFIQDVLLCAFAGVMLFLFTLAVSGGEIQAGMLTAVFVGFAVSHALTGRLITAAVRRIRKISGPIRHWTAQVQKTGRKIAKKVCIFFKKGLHCIHSVVYNQSRE